MVTSRRSRSMIAMFSFALTLSAFPATSAGASEVPNSTTSTAFQIETEKLTEQDRQAINKSLGYSALPSEADALRKDGDEVHVLNAEGDKLPIDVKN